MATTKFELWLEKVNQELEEKWNNQFEHTYWTNLYYTKGRKFIKIIGNGRVWGFVSMVDGTHKGEPIKEGDLLMAATWNQPAKHSRGNIFDGTDQWGMYGPVGMTTMKKS